jgi:hypothetical protein
LAMAWLPNMLLSVVNGAYNVFMSARHGDGSFLGSRSYQWIHIGGGWDPTQLIFPQERGARRNGSMPLDCGASPAARLVKKRPLP